MISVPRIFFSTATENVVKSPDFYISIVNFIEDLGTKITRNWVKECIWRLRSGIRHLPYNEWHNLYTKVKKDLDLADAIIFDITMPSVGVGLILGMAINRQIPILILVPRESYKAFSKGLVAGVKEPFVTTKIVRTREDYYTYIREFLSPLVLEKPTQKFPLRLSAKEYTKLRTLAKKQNVSINTSIRRLIQKCKD